MNCSIQVACTSIFFLFSDSGSEFFARLALLDLCYGPFFFQFEYSVTLLGFKDFDSHPFLGFI